IITGRPEPLTLGIIFVGVSRSLNAAFRSSSLRPSTWCALVASLAILLPTAAACRGSSDPPPPSPITTPSGLTYLDLSPGHGESARNGDTLTVQYSAWLADNGRRGQRFASSRDTNEPFVFRLGAGQVIAGWDEGLVGMRVGGMRRLIVPPALVG